MDFDSAPKFWVQRRRGQLRNEAGDALDAFQRAAETGDLQSLLDILAPDVVFLGDGGGVVQAVLAPVVGAGKVARLLAIGLDRIAGGACFRSGSKRAGVLHGRARPGRG